MKKTKQKMRNLKNLKVSKINRDKIIDRDLEAFFGESDSDAAAEFGSSLIL